MDTKDFKIKKSPNQNLGRWLFLALLAILVIMGGWIIYQQMQIDKEPVPEINISDSQQFKNEYPDATASHPFVYLSSDEVLSKFETGTGMVFMGFPACPWCQALVSMVEEAAKAEQVDKVGYYNILSDRTEDSEAYKTLVAKLEPYLTKDEDGKPRIYVPDVTIVKDGKITGRFKMEDGTDEEMKAGPSVYWTVERKAQAVEQLRSLFKQIK